MTLHISEAELLRDFDGVVSRLAEGTEIMIERDNRPLAVLRVPPPRGRTISECIALAKSRGTTAVPDEGFAADVEEGIAGRNTRRLN